MGIENIPDGWEKYFGRRLNADGQSIKYRNKKGEKIVIEAMLDEEWGENPEEAKMKYMVWFEGESEDETSPVNGFYDKDSAFEYASKIMKKGIDNVTKEY